MAKSSANACTNLWMYSVGVSVRVSQVQWLGPGKQHRPFVRNSHDRARALGHSKCIMVTIPVRLSWLRHKGGSTPCICFFSIVDLAICAGV